MLYFTFLLGKFRNKSKTDTSTFVNEKLLFKNAYRICKRDRRPAKHICLLKQFCVLVADWYGKARAALDVQSGKTL